MCALGQILGLVLGLISFGPSFINEILNFIYFVNIIFLADNNISKFGTLKKKLPSGCT